MSNPLPVAQNLVSLAGSNSNMNGLLFANLAPGVTFEHMQTDENGRTGSETTWTYGGSYAALKVQQAWCRGWGAYNMSLSRESGGTLWKLVAVFPFNEYSTEAALLLGTFELDVEMNQPSVYSNPILRGVYNSSGVLITAGLLPDNYIAAVARIVENFEAGLYSMTNVVGGSPVTDAGWSAALADVKASVPTTNNNQARALQLFATVAAHKTTAFIEYYHVFKRTITAALPIQIQASMVGKGQIWTTQELVAFENVSATFFQLDPTSYWLKSPPVVSTAAHQKSQVAYNYTEFKQANGLLYKAYNNAVLQYSSPTDLPPGS